MLGSNLRVRWASMLEPLLIESSTLKICKVLILKGSESKVLSQLELRLLRESWGSGAACF